MPWGQQTMSIINHIGVTPMKMGNIATTQMVRKLLQSTTTNAINYLTPKCTSAIGAMLGVSGIVMMIPLANT